MDKLNEHKKNIQVAAYNWAMEDLHQVGAYDSFFDMLLGETDDRWIIPSFLVVKLSNMVFRKDGMFSLALFLSFAIKYNALYEYYVAETRKLLQEFLPDDEQIAELFGIYDKILALPESDRTEDAIKDIVDDNEYDELFY